MALVYRSGELAKRWWVWELNRGGKPMPRADCSKVWRQEQTKAKANTGVLRYAQDDEIFATPWL
jgi:hypothetical protein